MSLRILHFLTFWGPKLIFSSFWVSKFFIFCHFRGPKLIFSSFLVSEFFIFYHFRGHKLTFFRFLGGTPQIGFQNIDFLSKFIENYRNFGPKIGPIFDQILGSKMDPILGGSRPPFFDPKWGVQTPLFGGPISDPEKSIFYRNFRFFSIFWPPLPKNRFLGGPDPPFLPPPSIEEKGRKNGGVLAKKPVFGVKINVLEPFPGPFPALFLYRGPDPV